MKKLKLVLRKTYPIFVPVDQFLHDLQHKQILRETDRQTLNCRMAIFLTMVLPEKEDLSNKKNYENRSINSKIIDEETITSFL